MSVGRLSQGQQWPMCAHLVPRLLWCAPLSEKGVVQDWGSKSWRQRERVWWRAVRWQCQCRLQQDGSSGSGGSGGNAVEVALVHLHLHMHHLMHMHMHVCHALE